MQTFTIKRGDTSPALLLELGGAEISLAGATVVFSMVPFPAGAAVISRAAAGVAAGFALPVVQYDWTAGDTAAAGDYLAEFEVTFSDGTRETFPNGDHLLIRIVSDLA